MRIFWTVFFIFLVALFSTTFLPKLTFFNALPNLILVFSLFFIFQKEYKTGLAWAILGGLFLDFLGLKYPSNIFLLIAIFLLAWFLVQRFFESSGIFLFLIFCFLGSLVYDLLFLIVNHLLLIVPPLVLLGNACYSALLALIIYLIYLFWFKKEALLEIR